MEPKVPLPSNNELSTCLSSATFVSCCSKVHVHIIVCLHLHLPTDTFQRPTRPAPPIHYFMASKSWSSLLCTFLLPHVSHPDINSSLLSRSHRTTGDIVPLCLVFVACLTRLDSCDDSRLVSLLPLCHQSDADWTWTRLRHWGKHIIKHSHTIGTAHALPEDGRCVETHRSGGLTSLILELMLAVLCSNCSKVIVTASTYRSSWRASSEKNLLSRWRF